MLVVGAFVGRSDRRNFLYVAAVLTPVAAHMTNGRSALVEKVREGPESYVAFPSASPNFFNVTGMAQIRQAIARSIWSAASMVTPPSLILLRGLHPRILHLRFTNRRPEVAQRVTGRQLNVGGAECRPAEPGISARSRYPGAVPSSIKAS